MNLIPTYLRRSGGIVRLSFVLSLSLCRGSALAGFRSFRSILGATASALGNPVAIQRTTDDMIAHARQVLHAATTNQNDGVLLQVMPFTRNIRRDLHLIAQPNASDLTHGRIRLLGSHGAHLGTHTTFLWRSLQARCPVLQRVIRVQQRRGLDLTFFLRAALTDQLIDRRQ